MDEEDEKLLLTTVYIDKIEYVWYREEDDDDYSLTTTFWFSDRARVGYTKMTRYYL